MSPFEVLIYATTAVMPCRTPCVILLDRVCVCFRTRIRRVAISRCTGIMYHLSIPSHKRLRLLDSIHIHFPNQTDIKPTWTPHVPYRVCGFICLNYILKFCGKHVCTGCQSCSAPTCLRSRQTSWRGCGARVQGRCSPRSNLSMDSSSPPVF
jgi:hypothetical protein